MSLYSKISILQHDTRIWQEFTKVEFQPEVEEWLVANAGPRLFMRVDDVTSSKRGWFLINGFHSISPSIGTVIRFIDPRDAVLFKLTWL